MLEGIRAVADRRDRQDWQHLGSLTLTSETTDWPQYGGVSCQVCSLYTSQTTSRPHLHHNRLQTHKKSSSKAGLRKRMCIFGYFLWEFPPTRAHTPLAYSTTLPQLSAGKIAASQQGFLAFGWAHYSGACILREPVKADHFSILCNLTYWSNDCKYTAEFVRQETQLVYLDLEQSWAERGLLWF